MIMFSGGCVDEWEQLIPVHLRTYVWMWEDTTPIPLRVLDVCSHDTHKAQEEAGGGATILVNDDTSQPAFRVNDFVLLLTAPPE